MEIIFTAKIIYPEDGTKNLSREVTFVSKRIEEILNIEKEYSKLGCNTITSMKVIY